MELGRFDRTYRNVAVIGQGTWFIEQGQCAIRLLLCAAVSMSG